MSGEERAGGVADPLPAPLASLAAALFGGAVALRNALFARGFLAVERAPLPVISVGNLAVGGTGKTPLVLAIAQWLLASGIPVALLTRGHGRRARATILRPAGGPLPAVAEIGDEPWFLARRAPGVTLGVDADRRRAARALAPLLAGGVFLLDDGFQHRRLARDLDLVALAAADPLAAGRLLPAGRLREPPSALGRAHRGILVHGPTESPADVAARAREVGAIAPALPLATAAAAIAGVRPLGDFSAPLLPPGAIAGPVAAVAGIARPERLAAGLRAAGIEVAMTAAFPDHHPFSAADRPRLAALTRVASTLVTTEKDEPRLLAAFGPGLAAAIGAQVLVAELALRFETGEDDLRHAVLGAARGERAV